MNFNTKLLHFTRGLQNQTIKQITLFEMQFAISLFIFFLGFINGNLFGTLLIFFRQWVVWDVAIIILTILIIEFINYLHFYLLQNMINFDFKMPTTSNNEENENVIVDAFNEKFKPNFRSNKNSNLNVINDSQQSNRYHREPLNFHWMRLINFYKIGLLLGFFIDAFKVGS